MFTTLMILNFDTFDIKWKGHRGRKQGRELESVIEEKKDIKAQS